MHRSSHFQGYNATSQYKDAAGQRVGVPVCNPGSSLNSVYPGVSISITVPFHMTSHGGGCVVGNAWSGLTGQWNDSHANRTVVGYTVDLDTGAETGPASIGSFSSITSSASSANGPSDVPCIIVSTWIDQNYTSMMLSDGVARRVFNAPGISRYVYKQGQLFLYSAATGLVYKATPPFPTDDGITAASAPSATSAMTFGTVNTLEVDPEFVYVVNFSTITVLHRTTLALVTTLTHPSPVNTQLNTLRYTEYGQLYAIGQIKVWKHDGSNFWTEVNSDVGDAKPHSPTAYHPLDWNFVSRNVLYRIINLFSTSGSVYWLSKSIRAC